jgi:hypothetical protein
MRAPLQRRPETKVGMVARAIAVPSRLASNKGDLPGNHALLVLRSARNTSAEPETHQFHTVNRAQCQNAVLLAQRTFGNAATGKLLQLKAGSSAPLRLQCPLFASDAKLEQVLNDNGRLREGDAGDSVSKVQQPSRSNR